MASERLVIGIDLGGTKISTGLVSESAQVIARDYRETVAAEGEDAVIRRMVDAAHTVMQEAYVTADQVAAVGVGSGSVISGTPPPPPTCAGGTMCRSNSVLRMYLGSRPFWKTMLMPRRWANIASVPAAVLII